MKKIYAALCVGGILVGALAGCGGGGDSSAGQQPAPSPGASSVAGRGEAVSPARQEQGLTFVLSSPRSSYRRGEKIPLTLTVTNTTSQTITTYFNNPARAVLGYYEESGEFIDGNGYAGQHVEDAVTYEPGQSRQYTLQFSQLYKEMWLPVGRKRFVGWLTGSTERYWFTPKISELRSETVAIDVTE